MYINHITMTTGHNARTSRADVADDVLAVVAPWLSEILNSGGTHPLPVQTLSHYSAIALAQDGGLLMTIYGPAGPHEPGKPANAAIPLVTFGVAQRSRHGRPLWDMLLARFEHKKNIEQPGTPWCAVVVHPSSSAHRSVFSWLADFERCCAWA
ncbi:MAG TPA: hypothetical protein VFX01_08855, partial [Methylophilaceae bacterium]|nr:hypothetical protein [Methylophilaceae bacterium]